MHDLKKIEANPEEFKKHLEKRSFSSSVVDTILGLNNERKKLTNLVETNKSEMNKISKEVGLKKRNGEDASSLMQKVSELKSANEASEKRLVEIKESITHELEVIPNILADDVPFGKDENDNVEMKKVGTPRTFSFKILEHSDLGEKLDMLDFERAAKLTGARFVVYKKDLARLERALANYMLDFHRERGYEEIIPPFIVHARSLYGTGQLPKFKEDVFKIEGQDWYLIPTSEVPLTNLKREEIFDASEFPIKLTALTPCFRSEAGSHGKDTKGLIRMHQFNKVEMVNIVHPDESDKTLDEMVDSASTILENLGLAHRIIKLCSGDTGFGAIRTYDLEVWIPSQNTYREISSCSNCGDFQARRASIRFKKGTDKPQFAHTLNGSGLAVGRTMVAIMENYQNEDGSITIPEVIRPYMGGQEKISAK